MFHQASFGIYTNYFVFLMAMLSINVSQKLMREGFPAKPNTSRLPSSHSSSDCCDHCLKSISFKGMMKRIFMNLLSYSLIFMVIQISQLCCSYSEASPLTTMTRPQIPSTFQERMLEEQTMAIQDGDEDELIRVPSNEKSSPQTLPIPKVPEKISLSMGNIISSLNIDVTSMVLSKDKKIAFATLYFYGTLKIIDISDLQAPVVIGSLSLRVSSYYFELKSLVVSSDEKTLYISNSRELEIIDITDLGAPKLISFTPSTIFDESMFYEVPKNFRTTIAIKEDTNTLFIGGIGFQVYDVSNPSKPALLKAQKNALELEKKTLKLMQSDLCLSSDGEILFIANGELEMYNVSNPKSIEQLDPFPIGDDSARDLYLSEDLKTMFLLGVSVNDEMILKEVDISDYKSPKITESFTLNYTASLKKVNILAVSPGRSKFYIYVFDEFRGLDLVIFDSLKGTTTIAKDEKSLIEKTFTMAFSQDGRFLITGSNEQLMVLELFLDYPNSQIFSSGGHGVSSGRNFTFPDICEQIEMSPDGESLFLLFTVDNRLISADATHIFEIWDAKTGKVLSSFQCNQTVNFMHFTNKHKTVYLAGEVNLIILDISNRSSPIMKKSYASDNSNIGFSQIVTSQDEQIGIIVLSDWETAYVSFYNLSDRNKDDTSSLPAAFTSLNKKFKPYSCIVFLKDNDKTLVVVDKEITIYDISNLNSPEQMASLPLGVNEPDPQINGYSVSPDNKTLYIETHDQSGFRKFRIYDISNSKSPYLISEKAFPKFNPVKFKPAFSLIADNGFLFQDNSLARVNLVDPKKPQISGIIPLSTNKSEDVTNYKISPDGKSVYIIVDFKEIRIVDMNIQETLYLKKEKFLLGDKYSDNIAMLRLAAESSEYKLMDVEDYKVIKLSLLDVNVAPNKLALDLTTSALPSWITFDRESNILTVEPKKRRDLGIYTFHSAFSLKIPNNSFDDLGTPEDPVKSEDLLVWLISLDYIDSQLFLTANFGSIEHFLLPSVFSQYKVRIYEILRSFYRETCTLFEIAPSLELNDLTVSTLNTGTVKAEIKLHPGTESQALFLSKSYGPVVPIITEKKSKFSIEGTIKEVNNVLQSVVVNFENATGLADASITITDGLNPPVTKSLKNISRYFVPNIPPAPNKQAGKSVQEQINSTGIYTGQYFTVTFDEDTFIDENSEDLKYDIMMAANGTALPDWLSLNGLTLKGTPPEEILGRDIDLVFIARNEFKQYKERFRVHVKISFTFVMKLILKYSPYILTAVGLFVSANKIFNILEKKRYKHLKEFFVGVGEEVSPDVIFPVAFIKEESEQSRRILKHLEKNGGTDLNEGGLLNKQKIIEKIEETVKTMPSGDREKLTEESSHPEIVNQIIINRFVTMELDSAKERKTRKIFEEIKPRCLEVVQKDPSSASGFTISQKKLNRLFRRFGRMAHEKSINLEESLLTLEDEIEGVNMSLLKDAILAYAFENHSLDMLPIDVGIEVKQKVKAGFLSRFLKFDLKDIYLNDKNKIDYGINYRIVGDKLCFFGVAQSNFKGKTLVVQITNSKHKILKEIWINGVSKDDLRKDAEDEYLIRDELEMRGQGYEVY